MVAMTINMTETVAKELNTGVNESVAVSPEEITPTVTIPAELQAAAEVFLDKFISVKEPTVDGGYTDAEELVADATRISEERSSWNQSPEALIAASTAKQQFQVELAKGCIQLVAVSLLDGMHLADGFPFPPAKEFPLELEQAGPLANAAEFGAGAAVFSTATCPGILTWKYNTPISLSNEADLLVWLGRIRDDFGLGGIGFLSLRNSAGELFSVFALDFGGWVI